MAGEARVSRWRIVATVWLFLTAIAAGAIGAVALHQAIATWSPLEQALAGAYVPAFTATVIRQAPMYPWALGGLTFVVTVAGIALWRSSRSPESRTWAATWLAGFLLAIAAVLPMQFLVGYFVLPRVAAAALAA